MRYRNDRGSVLVIVAVFALVAVIMLAFVVDIGGLREQKKEVTLSTDAAALAVAGEIDLRTFGVGTYQCSAVPVRTNDFANAQLLADSFLTKNGGTSDAGCRVEVTGRRRGYVVVGGTENVPYAFGPAIGQTSGDVNGVSASVARVDDGGGLRPIGVCAVESSLNVDEDGNPYSMKDDVINAPKDGDGNLDTPVDLVLKKDHLKKDEENCNVADAAGQRGQLDLGSDGSGAAGQCMNSNVKPDQSTFNSDTRYGYFGDIAENDLQDSGNNWTAITDCLTDLINTKQLIWLPVYDGYDKGPPSTFHITHFVEAQLTGYCLQNGSAYYPNPPAVDCKLPVAGESDAEWFRFTAYRVEKWKSSGPPRTDDSLRDSPAICAEKDDAVLLKACIPPDPPDLGTPPDPNPPPIELCEVSSASVSPTSAPGSNGSPKELQASVTVTVELADLTKCLSPLTIQLVQTTGNLKNTIYNEIPTSTTLSVTVPAGSVTYAKGKTFEVVVTSLLGTLPYSPVATLTTT